MNGARDFSRPTEQYERDNMNKTDRAKRYAADLLVMILGAAVYALSVSFFTAPNGIAPGGVTGLATMVNHLFPVPIGITVLLLNIPLFLWGAVESGWRFILRTVIATALASVLIDVFSAFGIAYHGDRIIAAVFGGIGSIPGAMVGGLVLGIIEQLSKYYISQQISDAIVFAVLVIILLVRPTGLFGKVVQEKV